jgi:addiction module RelE/StbE family toxin
VAGIIWSREAEEDLRAIREYIARDNPQVADRIIDRLVASVDRLHAFPSSGRPVEELENEGVREVIVAPYHVAYHVTGEVVEILKVWHGKRMLSPEDSEHSD